MKLKFAVASLLAAASMGAFAADQVVTLDPSNVTYFDNVGTAFEGGSDLITFDGLAAGLYNITITLSAQNVKFDGAATTLNGSNAGITWLNSTKIAFMGVEATATSPFLFDLAGSLNAKGPYGYSGEVTISAVPEPTTYGMLLGGLGIMGFLARRKSKQA